MASDPRHDADPPVRPAGDLHASSLPPAQVVPPGGVLTYADPLNLLDGRLHPLTMVVSLIRAVQGLLPIIVVAVFLRASGRSSDFVELVVGGLGTLRVVGAIILVRTYRFWIDGGSLHIRSGLIFHNRRVIPLDRVQNINLKRDWIHQLLKLAEVQVETAGGAGAEATLSSLSVEQAELFRRQLLGLRQEGTDQAAGLSVVPAEVVYRAGLGRLLLAGATRNQAGAVLAAILGFGVWLGDLAGWNINPRLIRRMTSALPELAAKWVAIGVGLFALVVVGWLASMARSVITYYGFTLSRQEGRLRRSYGLFTKRDSVFPTHRLQLLRIEAPLIQRKVGLCRVTAETAGSFAEKEGAATSELCPIIESRHVGDLCRLVIDGLDLAAVPWRKVSRLTIRRAAIRYLFALAVITGLATLNTRHGLWLAAAAPLMIWAAILRYRALRWAATPHLLVLRSGPWTRHVEVIPRGKIQHTTLTQTPFQRRLGLATLGVRTAGGGVGGSGIRIPDLPDETAVALQDELMRPPIMPDPHEADAAGGGPASSPALLSPPATC